MSYGIYYADKINSILLRRGIIQSPLVLKGWAGPEWMKSNAYAFVIDTHRFTGRRIEDLHQPKVLHDISTSLGGLKVSYTNTQGFAYIIKLEKVPELDPVDLVKFLTNASCALIVGARGTGKTSLLQHVSSKRQHKVIVLDPKNYPGKWPGNVEAVGTGGNFEAMGQKVLGLASEMRRRLEDITLAHHQDRILLICDEWWITKLELSDFTESVMKLVTLGREIKIDVFICNPTKTVEGLGIQGEGALREAFEIVHLADGFKAYIETNTGKVRAIHPGPFESKPRLTKFEAGLVRFAFQHNNGSFAVGSLHESIKHKLPPSVWQSGGVLTYHKLQSLLSEWEERGLLIKHDDSPKSPRMPSPELQKMAGL